MDILDELNKVKVLGSPVQYKTFTTALDDYLKKLQPKSHYDIQDECSNVCYCLDVILDSYLVENDKQYKRCLGHCMILLINKWSTLFNLLNHHAYEDTLVDHLYTQYVKHTPDNERQGYWYRFKQVYRFIEYTIDDIQQYINEHYNKLSDRYWMRMHRYLSFHIAVQQIQYTGYIPKYVLARMCQFVLCLERYCVANRGVITCTEKELKLSNPNLGEFNCKVPFIYFDYPERYQVKQNDKPAFLGDYTMKEKLTIKPKKKQVTVKVKKSVKHLMEIPTC